MKSLILVLLAVSLTAASEHLITYKSCFRAHDECHWYLGLPLDTPSTIQNCEMRCGLMMIRSWDDPTGVHYPVLRNNFRHQFCDDQCYLQRTERCMDAALFNVSTSDVCARSLIIRNCFTDQYGYADQAAVDYLRPFGQRLRQIVLDCVGILQVPESELIRATISGPLDAEPLSCLLRCVAIRAGVYSDAEGPLVDRLELLYGAKAIEKDGYSRRGQKCVAWIKEESSSQDSCSRAVQYLDACFEDLVEEVLDAIKATIPKLSKYYSKEI